MMDGKKLFGILFVVAVAVVGIKALVTSYVTGTTTGTVTQAIYIKSCNASVGTCTVGTNNLTFVWTMGNVTQGSVYYANVTLENKANRPINVTVDVANVTAVGGNNKFESKIIVPTGNITVPANGTSTFKVEVDINPAEDPGEQYTITLNVAPAIP